nr:hypothetical protein [Rhizobium phaseoli]
MYGGGFATTPSYLADSFGTQFVGARADRQCAGQAASLQGVHDDEVAALQAKSAAINAGPTGSFGIGSGRLDAKAMLAWALSAFRCSGVCG